MNKRSKSILIAVASIVPVICVAILAKTPGTRVHTWFEMREMERMHTRETREMVYPERGKMYDCEGNTLVYSDKVFDAHLDCMVIADFAQWDQKSFDLSKALPLLFPEKTASEWWEHLRKGRSGGNKYLSIAEGISQEQLDSVLCMPLFCEDSFKGGRVIEERQIRCYPYGNLARRTLGYTRNGAHSNQVGLEGSFDTALSGKAGSNIVKTGSRNGRRFRKVRMESKPVPASDIHTTIDIHRQAVADSVLRATMNREPGIERAMLLMMEKETGAIRAMVNLFRSPNDGEIGEYYNYCIGWHYTMEDIEYKGHRLSEFCLPKDMDFDLEGRRIPEFPADAPGTVKLSLLDVLSISNTVAGSGRMVQPYLVESVQKDGETFYQHEVKVLGRPAVPEEDYAGWTEQLSNISLDGATTFIRILPDYCIVCVLEGGPELVQTNFFDRIVAISEAHNLQ